jgi:DNA-binding XRE family transcriptional regulator
MMNAQRNRGMYLRVGERLAEICKSRKISQAKLAKLLGVVEGTIQNYEHARNEPNITRLYEAKRGRQPPCGIHLPAQSATDSVPAGRANRQAGADTQCRRLSVVGWSRPICFSFNAGQWVARPVCPAAQAANFGLVDLQLTEADRRPFKLPLRLGAIAALRRRSSSSNRE